MALFDYGSPPIHSTQTEQTNTSTSTLIAEIDSTVLGTAHFKPGQSKVANVTWLVGGSSNGSWLLEQVLSTGLGSTAFRKQVGIYAPAFQSGQYITRHVLEQNDRLRVRASTLTIAYANIICEYLT
jgi:hypothetical protein